MANDFLETTSRLVAWRIDSLDKIKDFTLESREFMIGKWYWLLEYCCVFKEIKLVLKPKDRQISLPYPIASLVVHVFCSKESPTITTRKVFRDIKMLRGEHCAFAEMDIGTIHATTTVTFCIEFLDLKLEDGNDGKIKSIWKEEPSGSNTSDEPVSRMLSESIYTDIVINARDGRIEAHRAVLAAYSPVFKTMFSKNYIERETSTVNMDDMSIGACRAMLNFIYGNTGYNELRAHTMELMVAADKYDIVKFKMVCEASLCGDVGAKNVFARLLCAHRYGFLELKSVCLFYLVKMGMIFDLLDDYSSFIVEADPQLVLVVTIAILDGWKAN